MRNSGPHLLPGGRRWLAEGEPDEGVKIKKIYLRYPSPTVGATGAYGNPLPLGEGLGYEFLRPRLLSLTPGPGLDFGDARICTIGGARNHDANLYRRDSGKRESPPDQV